MSDAHGRDHVTTRELALDKDGKFLGLRVHTLANMGAYLSTFAPCIPTYLYATLLAGVYTTPVIYCEVKAVFTNTVPVDAYRGAGRPEATYLLERLVDMAAARDAASTASRSAGSNFIPHGRVPLPDAGRAAIRQRRLSGHARPGAGRRRTGPASKRGGPRPPSAASCAASASPPTSRPAASRRRRWWAASAPAPASTRSAGIRVHPTGSRDGAHRHAQPRPGPRDHLRAARRRQARRADRAGRHRAMATPTRCRSAWAPTARARWPSAASALVKAMDKVIAKGKRIAAHLMEASVADIEFKDGNFRVAGTDKTKAFGRHRARRLRAAQLSDRRARAGPRGNRLLRSRRTSPIPAAATSAEVEIDPETGVTSVVNFTAVDDVGTVINPMIVEGQVHGGVAQGIGQALLESCVYDAERPAAVRAR